MQTLAQPYLAAGLAMPIPESDGLSAPYWQGLRHNKILAQRCQACQGWQFGPEWICHRCHSFELSWQEVPKQEGNTMGVIYSWERNWHPVHPSLRDQGPYLIVLVALPQAGGIRMLGNLLGDALQTFEIGDTVQAEFEHHIDSSVPQEKHFSLLQWRKLASRQTLSEQTLNAQTPPRSVG